MPHPASQAVLAYEHREKKHEKGACASLIDAWHSCGQHVLPLQPFPGPVLREQNRTLHQIVTEEDESHETS